MGKEVRDAGNAESEKLIERARASRQRHAYAIVIDFRRRHESSLASRRNEALEARRGETSKLTPLVASYRVTKRGGSGEGWDEL